MKILKSLFGKQKRLITIFMLTIVLPSVALSIFGIRAISSEKYRREQEILNNEQTTLLLLKQQFTGQLKSVETLLTTTVSLPAFLHPDYEFIRQHIIAAFTENIPVEQVFILFDDERPFFPLLEPSPVTRGSPEPDLSPAGQRLLADAWNMEFVRHDYSAAEAVYQDLYRTAAKKSIAAQMLNHLARIQKKAGHLSAAVRSYETIIRLYPTMQTSTGLPLGLSAAMQLIECDRLSGKAAHALQRSLDLYRSVLDGNWALSESQFLTYTDLLRETTASLLDKGGMGPDPGGRHRLFSDVTRLHEKRKEQWHVRRQIETEIIPALKGIAGQSGGGPVYHHRMIEGREFLITAVTGNGLLGVAWDSERLLGEWLQTIIRTARLDERFDILISDQAENILLGEHGAGMSGRMVSGDFDSYFPPWKIHIVQKAKDQEGGVTVYLSYYFWSIVLLMMILVFGTWLVIRTMTRERDLIALKAEFVSSVTHELKTPLTSIRALTERLLSGKVTSSEKMHQYYSIIDQDTNKLMRLVKNVLDFSRIEAGKKEYFFEPTDIGAWLNEIIDDFSNDHLYDNRVIQRDIEEDAPLLNIDRDALSQCLNNLLENAIKFSPDASPVSVICKKTPDYLEIRVEDKGVGIPKDELDQIFLKFFQGRLSAHHSVKGAGLGLALVKHVTEAHGGKVAVESTPGEGAVFTLLLPMIPTNP
ncbi:hypothetical protein JXO52_07400 [bacterium]|nr:hypothetical protein [bacterium]